MHNTISQERVLQLTKADAVTSLLLEWLNKAKRPDDEEMEGTFHKLRYYSARYDQLLMKDEILKLLNKSDDVATTTFRAIVPKRARQRILELAHSSVGGGHFEVQKTVNKLKATFSLESLDKRRSRLV